MPEPFSLEDVLSAVQSSRKYAQISPSLVEKVATEELLKHKDFKALVKSVRTRLHRLTGAFLNNNIGYAQLLEKYAGIPPEDHDKLDALNRETMRLHSSTAERLPFVQRFYEDVFSTLPPVHSVLDLACGLNPLAMDYMPLAEGASYMACDVVEPEINFLKKWFKIRDVNGQAFVCDLLCQIPHSEVQLTLILKTLPILDQIDSGFSTRLISELRSQHILISYPTKSLGGYSKGMLKTYTHQFERLTINQTFKIQRFEFSNEIAFLLSR